MANARRRADVATAVATADAEKTVARVKLELLQAKCEADMKVSRAACAVECFRLVNLAKTLAADTEARITTLQAELSHF